MIVEHALEENRLPLVQGEVKDLVKDYTAFESQLNLHSKLMAQLKETFDIVKDIQSRLNKHYELIDAQDEKLKALKNRSEEMRKCWERLVSFEQQARKQRIYRLEQSLKTQMDKPGKPLPHPFTKICE